MRNPEFAQPLLFLPNPWNLSYAQGRVMVLLVQGLSGKAIASEMGVSVKTVETYLARIREKMGVENTLKAALMWDRHFREAAAVVRVPNRWYLAGPMTGIHDLNFPAFHRHAAKLRAEGLEVINPAEINADKQMAWGDCMRADIAALVTCEGIALMPDWTFSNGATLEHHIAERLGMKVRLLEMLS
jgi:DNA-binding CsgD family transcriptional regulator